MNPVAFLDDDPVTFKRRLLGVPVKGGADDIDDLIPRCRVEEVVFSTSAIEPARDQKVREACGRLGIRIRRFHLEMTG